MTQEARGAPGAGGGTGARPLFAAAALRRADGRVLLVRHAAAADGADRGGAGDRWTLPAEPVAADETAEQAVERLLRARLRVAPARMRFSDSIALPGAIANVFLCTAWGGGPQYAPSDYLDAAWAPPHAPGAIELAAGVREWLRALPADPGADPAAAAPDAAALAADLAAAGEALLAAYLAIDAPWRDVSLDGDWAPIDLLAHCATVEAYYAAEARRLIAAPGHTWRGFNPDQEAAGRAGRARPADDRAERARLKALREETLAWLETLGPDELGAWGDHAGRGAVRVGERIARIADHDRAHAAQLAKMLRASQADPGGEEERDAAADR